MSELRKDLSQDVKKIEKGFYNFSINYPKIILSMIEMNRTLVIIDSILKEFNKKTIDFKHIISGQK